MKNIIILRNLVSRCSRARFQ